MAEALGLAASIIAVIGAADGVAKAFAKVKDIRNAPNEVLALMNEVSDLTLNMENIQKYTQKSQVPESELQQVFSLVDKANDILLQLNTLIEYRLMKPDSGMHRMRVSRVQWLREGDTIRRFQQKLRDIRLDIATQMALINRHVQRSILNHLLNLNSLHQSRISLVVEEIRVISSQLQSGQSRAQDYSSQQLDDIAGLLRAIPTSQSDPNLARARGPQGQGQGQHMIQETVPSASMTAEEPFNSVFCVRAYASWPLRSSCTARCPCACHSVRNFQSSLILRRIIGFLFVGYSGFPIQSTHKCTEGKCFSRGPLRVHVEYFFPRLSRSC